jgi:putative MFS transporter
MKPATLGFVLPGMRGEYGLTQAQVAVLPTLALTGTVLGSLVWGVLADRAGRRPAMLLAGVLFIGTSICGIMPSFELNLLMCFLMGVSAGGMLPIVYALIAETAPPRQRGWLMVLEGGVGSVGGYLAASGAATLLEPAFGWRIMWLLGLPTGFLLVLLSRWVPESLRLLLIQGRRDEAEAVMSRFGVRLRVRDEAVAGATGRTDDLWAAVRALAAQPYGWQTLTLLLIGVGWGLVNFGFVTFLPTMLGGMGFAPHSYRPLLFWSALVSAPGTLVVAVLYRWWSRRATIVACIVATAVALASFTLLRPSPGGGFGLALAASVVALLVASGGVVATLSPYAAEVYPTWLRGAGGGLAAAACKLGGVVAPGMFAALLPIGGGLAMPALVVACPIALGAVVMGSARSATSAALEDVPVSTRSA